MNSMNRMPEGLLGGGQPQAPQGVGNVMGLNPMMAQKMYPMWQQQSIEAQTQGQPFPQFNEWLQMQQSGQMMGTAP